MKLLDKKQTYEKVGIGRSKFDDMVRNGIFPPPQYLPGSTKKLWLESTVDEWLLASLTTERPVLDTEVAQ